jgi:hypothetical protein
MRTCQVFLVALFLFHFTGAVMNIGFTGHRDKIANEASLLRLEERFPGATWIHGGAIGFDTQVNEIALRLGKVLDETLIVIPPDYDSNPMQTAPLIRNEIIVKRSDILVALFDGRKRGGTVFTIGRARINDLPILFLTPKE